MAGQSGHKNKLGRQQMIITASDGSHIFTGYRENAI